MKPQLRKQEPKKQGTQLRKQDPIKRGPDIPYKDFKYKKEALAITIAILVALLVLVFTSGGSDTHTIANQSVNKTPDIKTNVYSAGGIYLEYPESWKITTDDIEGNKLQLVIQDPSSVGNPNSTQLAAFSVYKVEKTQYETLEQRKEIFVEELRNNGANINLVSTTNVTIGGINAYEAIYDGKGPQNEQLQLKLIYFEQDNIFYILAFLTKGMTLDSQKANFDVAIKSFRLQ